MAFASLPDPDPKRSGKEVRLSVKEYGNICQHRDPSLSPFSNGGKNSVSVQGSTFRWDLTFVSTSNTGLTVSWRKGGGRTRRGENHKFLRRGGKGEYWKPYKPPKQNGS
ncbi:hypothetical protein TWF173_002227 [Orbilia oligospora]|uniref:Uncharacterized protein n=1 Tax=Orbilia oligospora TaxID=2813651 RepID=A0A7C8RG56_ORBOL|nr:hypothetical protein TWF970_005693 [Orbilia oligospora]KAF3316381.1 hypothetical protein TWF173_002227 [Orbilia oligospora]